MPGQKQSLLKTTMEVDLFVVKMTSEAPKGRKGIRKSFHTPELCNPLGDSAKKELHCLV